MRVCRDRLSQIARQRQRRQKSVRSSRSDWVRWGSSTDRSGPAAMPGGFLSDVSRPRADRVAASVPFHNAVQPMASDSIFIDTSVVRQFNFDVDSAPFKTLKDLALDNDITLVTTDV